MNIFRLIGDFAHLASKCILIWSIHRNKSAEGISVLTQGMYALIFLMRYVDLFYSFVSIYNTFMKIVYIGSSLYILVVMLKIYPHTEESHRAMAIALISVVMSFIISIPLPFIVYGAVGGMAFEILWTFSIVLESVCVIPQLLILRQTSVPTVINSRYLVALGSYRAFYILNWIYRAIFEGSLDVVAFIFGVVQTALYADFAWVYYSRQRIKLREGALVDSDDFGRSWLFRWVVRKDESSLEAGGAEGIFDADADGAERGRDITPEGPGRIALPPDAHEGAFNDAARSPERE